MKHDRFPLLLNVGFKFQVLQTSVGQPQCCQQCCFSNRRPLRAREVSSPHLVSLSSSFAHLRNVRIIIIAYTIINLLFMKLFRTSNIDVVKCCQKHVGFDLPSVIWCKRVKKFEKRENLTKKQLNCPSF